MQILKMTRILEIAPTISLLAFLLLGSHEIASQEYFVSQENGDYNYEFESPTDVTITDDATVEVPIGFDFNFFGNTYSTCHLSENGFIQFGTSPNGGCCQGQFLLPRLLLTI